MSTGPTDSLKFRSFYEFANLSSNFPVCSWYLKSTMNFSLPFFSWSNRWRGWFVIRRRSCRIAFTVNTVESNAMDPLTACNDLGGSLCGWSWDAREISGTTNVRWGGRFPSPQSSLKLPCYVQLLFQSSRFWIPRLTRKQSRREKIYLAKTIPQSSRYLGIGQEECLLFRKYDP